MCKVYIPKDSSSESSVIQELNSQQCTRSTQTNIALPPILPEEVEEVLRRYKLFNDEHNVAFPVHCTSSPVTQKPQIMSKSYSRITSLVSNTSGKKYIVTQKEIQKGIPSFHH